VSKQTLSARVYRSTAAAVGPAMIRLPGAVSAVVHTITSDKNRKFAGHALVSKKTGADSFFATPCHFRERRLNQHTSDLKREYFPKATDFIKVLNAEVQAVPGYLTPTEVPHETRSP